MKKIFVLASIALVAVSLNAKQYPDSVLQASAEEPNIAYGWNFEFAGGLGVGSYTYRQLFAKAPSDVRHVANKIDFPAWNAAFGLSYYFVPWMGIGTGVQFSSYVNNAAITNSWDFPVATDPFGDQYVLTAAPEKLNEYQTLYMLEIPIALKFRYRPGVVGLTATAGMKLGLPMYNKYKLRPDGNLNMSVYYEKYDLRMQDVPTVIEDLSVSAAEGQLDTKNHFKAINYAAYAELGMLIRVHQRVELAIAAFANYYINDVMNTHWSNDLAFADGRKSGEYNVPFTAPYNGVLRSNEVETLHPWSVGLKIGVQINANRTKAKRDYDREQRRLRKMQAEEPVDTVPEYDTIQAIVDTIPEIIEEPQEILDPFDQAILLIQQIAEENGINICEDICVPIPVFIHDTIYIDRSQPEQPKMKDSVAAVLDDHLRSAIIYFDLDKAIPILQPKDILIRIAEILKRHPEQKIHVNGHACKLGKPDYNKRLALRRANAVAAQLRALGVREDQMIIASLGSDVPFRYNGHSHQLAQDRRVEIIPVGRTTEIVQPGSRLAQIARRHYGNPDYWTYIYEANKEKISDPSNLPVGIELEIPDLSEVRNK